MNKQKWLKDTKAPLVGFKLLITMSKVSNDYNYHFYWLSITSNYVLILSLHVPIFHFMSKLLTLKSTYCPICGNKTNLYKHNQSLKHNQLLKHNQPFQQNQPLQKQRTAQQAKSSAANKKQWKAKAESKINCRSAFWKE